MPESMGKLLSARMGEDLYQRFTQLADDTGYERSDLLRLLVDYVVQNPPDYLIKLRAERQARLAAVS